MRCTGGAVACRAVGGHAPWSSCLWLTSWMRIWGKVLLWWAGAGVLSSGAESFRCPRRRVWKCRGGEEGWWVSGGWCWCRRGREVLVVGGVGVASGSQREAAGFGRRLAHGSERARPGKASQGRSQQAVCQGEGSRGEQRRRSNVKR
jgi:hypothetical protein